MYFIIFNIFTNFNNIRITTKTCHQIFTATCKYTLPYFSREKAVMQLEIELLDMPNASES